MNAILINRNDRPIAFSIFNKMGHLPNYRLEISLEPIFYRTYSVV